MELTSLSQLEKIASSVALFWDIEISPTKISLDFPVPRGMELVFEMFSSVWTTVNGGSIFGHHNRLFSPNSIVKSRGSYEGMPCPSGHVVFAEENQAVWFASTPSENGDDQPFFLNIPGNDPDVIEYPSVNSFLAGIILEESMNAASLNCPCPIGWDDCKWTENNFWFALNDRPHYGFGYTRFLMSDNGRVIVGGNDSQPLTVSSNFRIPSWLNTDLNN